MCNPARFRSASLSVLVSVFVLLAPCQARAFLDDDIWVTSGIIAGITLGACVVIVLLAGLLTDLKGDPDSAGTNWENALETALERLPPGVACPALTGSAGGLCLQQGGLVATERKGQGYPAADRPVLGRSSLDDGRPLLRAENLPPLPWLARSAEHPSALPSVMEERSLFQGEDEARSGPLY